MKLFGDFEAVRFPEENLIFITESGNLFYIYHPEHKKWEKYSNAGYDHITVENYREVGAEELTEAMGGVFPKAETDFMRRCRPSQLCIRDMLALLLADYPGFMSDREIDLAVHRFLSASAICHKSYSELKKLFDHVLASRLSHEAVLTQVKEPCFSVIGRDIFAEELEIVDGHAGSSYFWIMPARILDYSDTAGPDNVAEMSSVEISVGEDEVSQYLVPFLSRYFDDTLEANRKRVLEHWTDADGKPQTDYVRGFEWNLTHNFYTFDAITHMLKDICGTADALSSGRDNAYTAEIAERYKAFHADRIAAGVAEKARIVDFYRRFLYRIEYMMKVGKEKGFDLISFMGP